MRTAAAPGGFLLATASIWEREMVRFIRQPSRIVGLVAAPLLFWIFIGSGLGTSFQPGAAANGSGYLQYFFPGTVVMIVLFASIFSNMSTIEDWRDGFLLSVMVAPAPRASLVLGKIFGGTTQAMIPGLLFLLLAPFAGYRLGDSAAFLAIVILFLVSVSLTSLGFAVAWWMDSAQGFHAVLNLVLMPAWVLSGALFPSSGSSGWIRAIMRANPMSYEVEALRGALAAAATESLNGISLERAVAVTTVFAVLMTLIALLWAGRPTIKHLA